MSGRFSRGPKVAAPSLRGLWALGFVVLSLVALVALPFYYGRRVDVAQSHIDDVLLPAVSHSSRLRLLQARQYARMEGYVASGDAAFRTPYNAAVEEEDQELDSLRILSREMDSDVVRERLVRLADQSTQWRVMNEYLFDQGVGPGSRDEVIEGFDDLQRVTQDVEEAIQAEVDAGRRVVANEQQRASLISRVLALMALVATLMLGRVAARYRALTVEREERRRDAVRARREIDALLEATGEGVLGIDLDGTCISLNRAGSELLGYTEAEIVGRDAHATLFHTRSDGTPNPREGSEILDAVTHGRVLESGEGAIIWRRRGQSFPARWSLRPMIDGRELRGGVLSFTDITEIKEKEQALRRAIRQREDVVSIVSHDLRNPLGVTLAAADLLLDLPLDEKQRRRQAEIIRRSGKRMQHLIEDLLDVSRMEAGALVVRPAKEPLAPILEEVKELFIDQAEARGVLLEMVLCSEDPTARVDRDRIIQALSNLLDNAIRLTPEGGRVTLSAREDDGHVVLAVQDTGPGVRPEMVEHLFERFAMAEAQDGGSVGLGLTIVKGIADAHRGEVMVETELGVGSVFTLRMPKSGPAVGQRQPMVGD